MVMEICPFMSNNPYFVGCDDGYLTLLPSGVKCGTICRAWVDNKCIRLNDGRVSTSCNCKGDEPHS